MSAPATPACAREGCDRKGNHYLVICVPALTDHSRKSALRLVVGLPMCRDHADAADVQEFLTPDFRAKVRIQLMKIGKAMPDFSRAWAERGSMGDAEWNALARAREGR